MGNAILQFLFTLLLETRIIRALQINLLYMERKRVELVHHLSFFQC